MWKTEKKVLAFVEKYGMIRDGDGIVVGVSGGADSVCLLYLLKKMQEKWDFSLTAVHVNHQLRGEEASRDEEFVRELCTREGVNFQSCSADVGKMARETGKSLEEAGRNARYEIFSQVCTITGANKIALAHHQDDLAETMLHHLARGTGVAGLCSLKAVSGNRIRPLLCLTRQEVEEYLLARGLGWQTDSTNLDDHYTRNKIRHHVVNYLCSEINSRTVPHMAEAAEELGEMEELLDELTEEKKNQYGSRQSEGYILSQKIWQERELIFRRVIMKMLKEISGQARDFTRTHVEKIQGLLEKQVGKEISLPYGLTARRTYEGIWIGKFQKEERREKKEEILLKIPGETQVPGMTVGCEVILREKEQDKFRRIEEKPYTKWLDYDKIKNSLVFRRRCPGDRFSTHPEGGSRKLKDYFIDRKIPREKRDDLWLIADGQEILWVIEDRISQKYKVTEETRHILQIQIKGGSIHE